MILIFCEDEQRQYDERADFEIRELYIHTTILGDRKCHVKPACFLNVFVGDEEIIAVQSCLDLYR